MYIWSSVYLNILMCLYPVVSLLSLFSLLSSLFSLNKKQDAEKEEKEEEEKWKSHFSFRSGRVHLIFGIL